MYGRNVLSQVTGHPVQVAADDKAEFKPGGVTIDWSTVAAVSGSDVTLPDGTVVKVGQKYLRFGQVLTKITQAEVQTVDLSGADDPNGGTWTLTISGTRNDGSTYSQTVTAIAHNVSAADLQTAIRAKDFPGAANVTVSKSGFVYTITFPPESGNVNALTANGASLTTGGSTITITIGTTTQGVSAFGQFGPYDPSATDGRQTLSRGNAYILNMTLLEQAGGLNTGVVNKQVGGVLEGGLVWKQRLLMTTGTHTLAAGPTVTELETVFPRIQYAQS